MIGLGALTGGKTYLWIEAARVLARCGTVDMPPGCVTDESAARRRHAISPCDTRR